MRLASVTPAVAPSPAVDFIQQHGWLTEGEQPPVLELKPIDASTVDVIVGDANDGTVDGDHFYADTAASVLEPVVNGVKLLVHTRDGYQGEAGSYSGDEQFFANTLPGLTSQAAEVQYDVNGDGTVGDDEAAFLFPVATQADADRLDPIVRPQIGDYETRFRVEG